MASRQIRSTPKRNPSAREMPRQIWLAGLGAFSFARKHGRSTFNRMVNEGESVRVDAGKLARQLDHDFRRAAGDVATRVQAGYAPLRKRVLANLRQTEKNIGAGADETLAKARSIIDQSRAELKRVRDNARARQRRADAPATARKTAPRRRKAANA